MNFEWLTLSWLMNHLHWAVGILVGLSGVTPPNLKIMITLMSMINIGLGAFFTFIFLTQIQGEPDARKKKKKKKLD